MSILIKRVELKKKFVDVYVEDNIIAEIGQNINVEAEYKIDRKYMAIAPSMFNTHTHAAMCMLRGYADDMLLMDWLKSKIWPLEAKMTPEDIYIGSKLSCLEMIKSGTTFFNDMYWHPEQTLRAAKEMGMRAAIGLTLLDSAGENGSKETVKKNFRKLREEAGDGISLTMAPHAIYTVSEENLMWAKDFADRNSLMMHFHLSETETEVKDCIRQHGMRPAEYLDKIGFLGKNLITAHNVWLNDREIELLRKHNVKINYNPISNMKLAVGSYFNYDKFHKAGLLISLGTDGCSSNNSLDMSEEMKIAALLQKMMSNDPTSLPAREAFDLASYNGAQSFGIKAGRIKEGWLADFILIDLKNPCMMPGYNIISDMVYAANGNCVDTVVCGGKLLMDERRVEGEREIQSKAYHAAMDLYSR